LSARSRLYLRQRDGAAALADIDRLIELQPEVPLLFARRGAAKAIGGDRADALDDFDRASLLATDPDEIRHIDEIRKEAGL
jgi:regulator of sirC expression with transglutaminase-like and TPR domain